VSYSIQRKLRQFASLWQDPEGRNPSTVSDGPVQPVATVNVPHESAIYAWTNVEDTTTLLLNSWQYSRGIEPEENPTGVDVADILPAGFVWRLDHLGYACGAAINFRVSLVAPNLATTLQFGVNALASTGGSAIAQTKWLQGAQGTLATTTMPPPIAPFGAQVFVTAGVATACRIVAFATGFLRGSTFS
jgi:hypothetical protein